ncbi:MAG: DUF4468 domain-containing protein [Bacteroidota bacterium]
MKLLIAAVSFVLYGVVCFGQEKALALDERGKLIYYEVVEIKGSPKDSLAGRALSHLKKMPIAIKIDSMSGDTTISASGKMAISKNTLSMARPLGQVTYNLYVEVKTGKYRFWLTNFVFIPYMRDRYGNFVPSTAIGSPLERDPGKLAAADWDGYKKITAREAAAFAENFKKAMATSIVAETAVKPKPAISTKNW